MSQLDNDWSRDESPYLTLQQAFDLAKARQEQLNSEKSGDDEASDMISRKAI